MEEVTQYDRYNLRYCEGYIEGWESGLNYPEAGGYDLNNPEQGYASGLQIGSEERENYNPDEPIDEDYDPTYEYEYAKRQVEKLRMKVGTKAVGGSKQFHDEEGKFDDMAFRQHCLTLAQQFRPMGNGGVIGNGVPQGPEPIGEVLRRAQMFEKYLKDGEVIVPQGNNAMAV